MEKCLKESKILSFHASSNDHDDVNKKHIKTHFPTVPQ